MIALFLYSYMWKAAAARVGKTEKAIRADNSGNKRRCMHTGATEQTI